MGLETVAQHYNLDQRVFIMQNLDGIYQPYNCEQWTNFGGIESYNLVDDGEDYLMHELFSIYGYWHAVAILDSDMKFRYYTSYPNADDMIDIIEVILSENDWLVGDINFDQTIDILDVIGVVNNILNSNYNYLSDLNEDQVVNIQDIILLVGIILD